MLLHLHLLFAGRTRKLQKAFFKLPILSDIDNEALLGKKSSSTHPHRV